MSARSRAVAGGLVGFLIAFAFVLTPGAHAQCGYPGPCAGGDARFIRMDGSYLVEDRYRRMSVTGQNIGDDATVRTTLAGNNGVGKRNVSPQFYEFFVETNDAYRVFFRVRPGRGRRFTTLTSCTRAIPHDTDRSNNCGSRRFWTRRG